ncbi:hypothetical protein HHI36_007694 [Cryptolaemus montrouzieri]|uniref:Uncharacterized protein n=1 Tax=Cryptolaemus montrouzieri TaxID=559131 RepID=A0ABD2MR55_9CUCU
MVVGSRDFNDVQQRSEELRECALVWFLVNGLAMNDGNTQLHLLSLKADPAPTDAGEVSFLGVHLDPILTCIDHADNSSKRVSRNIFVMRQLASSISPTILKSVHFALIE